MQPSRNFGVRVLAETPHGVYQNDPLGLDTPPAPAPAPAAPVVRARPRTVECSFCGCVLTEDGEHLSLSDRAKKLRDQAQTIEDHERTIAKHVARIAQLETAERERTTAAASKSFSLRM